MDTERMLIVADAIGDWLTTQGITDPAERVGVLGAAFSWELHSLPTGEDRVLAFNAHLSSMKAAMQKE
jgi:hypothetical protein